jgi:hypothetical protein
MLSTLNLKSCKKNSVPNRKSDSSRREPTLVTSPLRGLQMQEAIARRRLAALLANRSVCSRPFRQLYVGLPPFVLLLQMV